MRYIILVSTLDRVYTFHETIKVEDKSLYLQSIFNSYLNVPETLRVFYEINSRLKSPKLRFNYDATSKYPKCFGFLTESGIFSGEVSAMIHKLH